MLKKRKLAVWGAVGLSSDAGYEFCHSFCSRRDNRVCAKDVCIFLGWLVERSGSILPGMLLHFINNTLRFSAYICANMRRSSLPWCMS